ncbi:polysaccharide deacetylase family protein [Reinekea marinisedimentorum]|uniref:Polysaccharide deacetylase n=1 Tax=Reinekea marinisedimentorum TaxID=230495 RepID=A0A4R3I4Y4_9GAMM|nr:polysaccharide deacetylase family protein [Reinekea marinisedimentorum]TCS40155.1 hypothetical protein BCF53_11076 [Reinekea marinisedimentorum]
MTVKPAVISIHDVMPETLSRVEHILQNHLASFPAQRILLLVVPGLNWSEAQLARLHRLQRQGYEFAGHGWKHEISGIRGLSHWLHSRLISRNAAEHLSYNQQELISLLTDNYRWFRRHGFNAPELYVPPAWALGALSKADLASLPFAAYETTRGFFRAEEACVSWLPLLGFEADTRLRAGFLKLWNAMNLRLATESRPVRLSIHPYDFEYLISGQLQAILNGVEAVHWRTAFESDCGNVQS